MHVLTLTAPDSDHDLSSLQVHTLRPGEFFPFFGGRKSGYYCDDAPAIITRWVHQGIHDTAYNIDDPRVWKWVDELINWHGFRVSAEQPCEDQTSVPTIITKTL